VIKIGLFGRAPLTANRRKASNLSSFFPLAVIQKSEVSICGLFDTIPPLLIPSQKATNCTAKFFINHWVSKFIFYIPHITTASFYFIKCIFFSICISIFSIKNDENDALVVGEEEICLCFVKMSRLENRSPGVIF
jgi:hypothetical protein